MDSRIVTEAFHHFPGIGPARLAQLQAMGIHTWSDLLAGISRLPFAPHANLIEECRQSLEALERRDVRYLCDRFKTRDRWRLLAHFLEETTFLDIETEGLSCDDPITVICCWHRGQMRTFVEHQNLDEFLHLLDDVTILATFNGTSFDIPRILSTFHIPDLPCPHIDLRWICHYQGLKGTLKDIATRLNLTRPADVRHVNGAVAVSLWTAWRDFGQVTALESLLRYCAADVILLGMLAHRLSPAAEHQAVDLWPQLPSSFNVEPSPRNFTARPVNNDGRRIDLFRTLRRRRLINASPT